MNRILKSMIVVIAIALINVSAIGAKGADSIKSITNMQPIFERLPLSYPFNTLLMFNDKLPKSKGRSYFEALLPEDMKGSFKALSLWGDMIILSPSDYGVYCKMGEDGSKSCVISPPPSSKPFENWMVIRYDDDGACAGCSEDDASEYFRDVQPIAGTRKSPAWNIEFNHLALLGPHLLFGWNFNWLKIDAGHTTYGHVGIIEYRDITKTQPPYFRRLVMDFTPTRGRNVVIIMLNYLKSLGLNLEQFKHVLKTFGVKPVQLKHLLKVINSWHR